MDLQKLILSKIKKNGQVASKELVKLTGFSRAYLNRFFKKMVNNRQIILVGKANQARYLLASNRIAKPLVAFKILKNTGLEEDLILEQIKSQSSIFTGITKNLASILAYGFTEILNNAIEHSRSEIIQINFQREIKEVQFMIRDFGVGVFKNVKRKFRLTSETEAINHLLKGKQTTLPRRHSGEGIFFTSKAADQFILESFGKKLIVDNVKKDIFINNIKPLKGTRATFVASVKTKRSLKNIFAEFAGSSFEFNKTKVMVKLGLIDNILLSRSQARRIIFGLDKFKEVILDFKGVVSIGQSFADEIFRVWQNQHPNINIEVINSNDNIDLMIKRVKI